MMFSDLSIGETLLWAGVPCLNTVPLDSFSYLGFKGHLLFSDMMGTDDPSYLEFGDRFILLYMNGVPDENVQVPLEQTPNQKLNIILGRQNCTLSIYYKEINPELLLSTYVTIQAPASGLVTDILTAVAAPAMLSYVWTVSNATILSGQGTDTITYQALSVAPVTLLLTSRPPQGGVTTATATTIIYDASAFAISAPEYVWAGQFAIVASIPYSGPNLKWVPSGAVRIIGGDTDSGVLLDAGRASFAGSISAVVASAVMSTWNFKIVPYTSSQMLTTRALVPDEVQQIQPELGWAYNLDSVSVDNMCWVRIYNTQADLDADAGRLIGDDPTTSIVWDGIFLAPGVVFIDPKTSGINGDAPRTKVAYVSVKNTDTGTRIINVNITRTETQVNNTF
jgi:hypothetical protein